VVAAAVAVVVVLSVRSIVAIIVEDACVEVPVAVEIVGAGTSGGAGASERGGCRGGGIAVSSNVRSPVVSTGRRG